jgi:hypothetical protein
MSSTATPLSEWNTAYSSFRMVGIIKNSAIIPMQTGIQISQSKNEKENFSCIISTAAAEKTATQTVPRKPPIRTCIRPGSERREVKGSVISKSDLSVVLPRTTIRSGNNSNVLLPSNLISEYVAIGATERSGKDAKAVTRRQLRRVGTRKEKVIFMRSYFVQSGCGRGILRRKSRSTSVLGRVTKS